MFLLWLAGILAGVTLVVLLTPVRIDLDLAVPSETDDEPFARMRVRWAFVSWSSGGRARPVTEPAPPDVPTPPSESPRGARLRPALAMLSTPGFARRCWQAVSDAGHALLPRRATVRARVGFDNPADTGMLMGAVATLAAIPAPSRWDVRIAPEFADAVLAGRAHLYWSLTPARVLWPIVRFLGAPVTWRAARAGWRARRAPS